jgi:hypothetical protein
VFCGLIGGIGWSFAGCASSEGDAADSGGEIDVLVSQEIVLTLKLPAEVVENEPFRVDVEAQAAGLALATDYEGVVTLSTDRGDLSQTEVTLEQGRAFVFTSLNREGLASLTVTDGTQTQSVPVTVRHPEWKLEPSSAPVLKTTPPPEGVVELNWNSGGIYGATVLADGAELVAFFTTPRPTTTRDSQGYDFSLGRAVSSDEGVTWAFEPDAPVLLPEDLGAAGFRAPHVLVASDGVFHLWVTPVDATEEISGPILHATSPDGLAWTPAPCLDLAGPAGAPWSALGADDAHVSEVSPGQFEASFTALGGGPSSVRRTIGFARGTCEEGWTDFRPLLEAGEPLTWESAHVQSPWLWRDGSVWRLLYVGESESGSLAVGYATSADGVTWDRSPANPVFVRNDKVGSWSIRGIGHPSLVMGADGEPVLFTIAYSSGFRGTLQRAVGR